MIDPGEIFDQSFKKSLKIQTKENFKKWLKKKFQEKMKEIKHKV